MKKSSLLFCLLFIVLSFFVAQKALAGVNDNVSGFAWSDSVGWVSFNNTSEGGAVNYGVNVDPLTGLFSGYAWSENLGWINFNQEDLTGCPSGECRAKLDLSTKKVSGWAKILSNEGWVSFSGVAQDGSSYGVSWDNTNQELEGMAWSSDDLGWLSFNCSNPEEGCGVDHKVVAKLDNTPPVFSSRDPDSRDWGKTDVSVAITYTDNISGIAYTRHCWTTGASCDPGTIDASTGAVVKDTTGQWTLCTRARDGVGNWSDPQCSAQGVYKVDTAPPGSYIFLSDYSGFDSGGWWTNGSSFSRPILETEEGGSGLDKCTYQIWNKGIGFKSLTNRNCNLSTPDTDPVTITVGAEGICSTEGENACILYVNSSDKAGNSNVEKDDYGGAGMGFTVYSVDWNPPRVGRPYVWSEGENPIRVTEGKPVSFKSSVSDVGGILNCSLIVDGTVSTYYMNLSEPSCINCTASIEYPGFSNLTIPHSVKVRCWDQYYGETQDVTHITTGLEVNIIKNNIPTIAGDPSYSLTNCASPTTQTNCSVDFSVSARDDDGDALSYAWNFGDTLSYSWHPGDESPYDPSHHYSAPGDYSVKVVVSDGRGGEIESSPILVHVDEANLFVNLTANPNSGVYPLNGVDLTASVSGNMFGTINYKFDCTNDGVWDFQIDSQTIETYTVTDLCNYSSAGTYTAKTFVERGIGGAENTVNISVKDNSPPEARISVTDYSSCGPGADASIAYTGCNFTLNNVSTDPNGQLDIKNSIWTIKNSAGKSVHESTCNGLCDWTLISTISAGEYVAHLNIEDQSFAQSTVSKDFVVRQDIIADFKCSSDNVNWKACEDSTFRPLKGSRVYFLDQSEKSEGSTEIRTRTWIKDNAPFSSANDSNPSDVIQGTIIELTVEDDAGRIDSQSYNIQTQLSIPEWQEISPF